MAEPNLSSELKKVAVKAALDAHKEGMSADEAHKHIYDEVLDANDGKPHKAAVAHGKEHLAKLKDSMEEETIYEFTASDDQAMVPDPMAKDSKRPADKTTGGEDAIPQFKTKIEGLNAIMTHLSELPKQKIADIFKGLTNEIPHDASKAKATRRIGGSAKDDMSDGETLAATHRSPTSAKGSSATQIAAEDMNVIFAGADLSEEVREKAKTIFEAAVNARLVTEIARLEEEFETALVEALEEKVEQLSENVDKYLSYAVEQWVEENEIAIESGLKTEVMEDFLHGLKSLFEENYVEIPDDKVDLVAELSAHVAELEEKINNVVKENVDLKDYVDTLEVNKIFAEEVDALPLTQQEKLRSLVEGIEYASVEEFTKKLNIIKETYFPVEGKKSASLTEEVEYDSDDEGAPKVASGPMAQYVTAISKSAKK
jgi:hypothetical protein